MNVGESYEYTGDEALGLVPGVVYTVRRVRGAVIWLEAEGDGLTWWGEPDPADWQAV